jgi:hypothetical protein
LLGHSKIESTVRYLGVDVDDAIELAVSWGAGTPGNMEVDRVRPKPDNTDFPLLKVDPPCRRNWDCLDLKGQRTTVNPSTWAPDHVCNSRRCGHF